MECLSGAIPLPTMFRNITLLRFLRLALTVKP